MLGSSTWYQAPKAAISRAGETGQAISMFWLSALLSAKFLEQSQEVSTANLSCKLGDPMSFFNMVLWTVKVKKRTPLKYMRIDQFFMKLYVQQGGMLPTQFPFRKGD